jgi:hypothetical protein
MLDEGIINIGEFYSQRLYQLKENKAWPMKSDGDRHEVYQTFDEDGGQ